MYAPPTSIVTFVTATTAAGAVVLGAGELSRGRDTTSVLTTGTGRGVSGTVVSGASSIPGQLASTGVSGGVLLALVIAATMLLISGIVIALSARASRVTPGIDPNFDARHMLEIIS